MSELSKRIKGLVEVYKDEIKELEAKAFKLPDGEEYTELQIKVNTLSEVVGDLEADLEDTGQELRDKLLEAQGSLDDALSQYQDILYDLEHGRM